MEFIDPHKGKSTRPHPAKFSDSILQVMGPLIPEGTDIICDPMAGVGKATLLGPEFYYVLNELEPEWTSQIDDMVPEGTLYETHTGDALELVIPEGCLVLTSPPYGNRMAEGSTASKQYGPQYQR